MSNNPPNDGFLSNKEIADLLWDFSDDLYRVFSDATDRAFFLDRMTLKKLYNHALECIEKAEIYFYSMNTQEGVAAARTLALLRRRLEPAVEEYGVNILFSDSSGYLVCRDIEEAMTDFNDDLERLAVAFEYPLPSQPPEPKHPILQPDFRINFPDEKALEGKKVQPIKNTEIEGIADEMMLEGEMYVKDFCTKYEVPRSTIQYWLELSDVVKRKCPITGAVIVSVPTLIKSFIRWKRAVTKSGIKSKKKSS